MNPVNVTALFGIGGLCYAISTAISASLIDFKTEPVDIPPQLSRTVSGLLFRILRDFDAAAARNPHLVLNAETWFEVSEPELDRLKLSEIESIESISRARDILDAPSLSARLALCLQLGRSSWTRCVFALCLTCLEQGREHGIHGPCLALSEGEIAKACSKVSVSIIPSVRSQHSSSSSFDRSVARPATAGLVRASCPMRVRVVMTSSSRPPLLFGISPSKVRLAESQTRLLQASLVTNGDCHGARSSGDRLYLGPQGLEACTDPLFVVIHASSGPSRAAISDSPRFERHPQLTDKRHGPPRSRACLNDGTLFSGCVTSRPPRMHIVCPCQRPLPLRGCCQPRWEGGACRWPRPTRVGFRPFTPRDLCVSFTSRELSIILS